MNESISVTPDFTACKYISDLYREMRTRMEWDDDYGENLSALWDILWGMPYKGDDFTIIRPLHFRNIPHGQDQPFTEYVDKICAIFSARSGSLCSLYPFDMPILMIQTQSRLSDLTSPQAPRPSGPGAFLIPFPA